VDPRVEFILSVAGAVIALLALCVGGGQLWAAVYPVWVEHRGRRLLNEKFSRGPFDKATIERSTRYYIRPKCSNIDPAQEQEPRHALVATSDSLFDRVDYFLDHDDTHRHLLVLADSGTGKTSFVLNYYAHNARRPKFTPHRLAIVPLGAKDADELIARVPDQEETVIFLDAFDEDTRAIEDHGARIRALMDACRKYRKVVITCRTQFFPKEEEIPVETGILRLGPRKAGEKGTYEFWKLYLSPFDDKDIEQYLRKRYPIWARRSRKKARKVVSKIPLLSVRPMLLAHIPDVVASGAEINYTYQLYEVMVDAWLERETTWADKDALREFSERLAVDIYLNRQARGMEGVPRETLPKLAADWGIELQPWQMTGRSLLNRDADGNYKFAHRSIMEYLFVRRLVYGDRSCCGVILTDQMKRFLAEMLWGSLARKLYGGLGGLDSVLLALDVATEFMSEEAGPPEPLDFSNCAGLSCFEAAVPNWIYQLLNHTAHSIEVEASMREGRLVLGLPLDPVSVFLRGGDTDESFGMEVTGTRADGDFEYDRIIIDGEAIKVEGSVGDIAKLLERQVLGLQEIIPWPEFELPIAMEGEAVKGRIYKVSSSGKVYVLSCRMSDQVRALVRSLIRAGSGVMYLLRWVHCEFWPMPPAFDRWVLRFVPLPERGAEADAAVGSTQNGPET